MVTHRGLGHLDHIAGPLLLCCRANACYPAAQLCFSASSSPDCWEDQLKQGPDPSQGQLLHWTCKGSAVTLPME